MARIERFEDIESWKKGRALTREIYRITSTGRLAQDFCLRDQMRRACISIVSNIAEGFERSGDREFVNFLAIAKGSCGELRSQLYLVRDLEYISVEQFESLTEAARDVGRLLSALMAYLDKSTFRGNRFRYR